MGHRMNKHGIYDESILHTPHRHNPWECFSGEVDVRVEREGDT